MDLILMRKLLMGDSLVANLFASLNIQNKWQREI